MLYCIDNLAIKVMRIEDTYDLYINKVLNEYEIKELLNKVFSGKVDTWDKYCDVTTYIVKEKDKNIWIRTSINNELKYTNILLTDTLTCDKKESIKFKFSDLIDNIFYIYPGVLVVKRCICPDISSRLADEQSFYTVNGFKKNTFEYNLCDLLISTIGDIRKIDVLLNMFNIIKENKKDYSNFFINET